MNNEKLIEEFLANGGKIEVLPPEEYEEKAVIRSTTKKVPELKTLPEGAFLYTKKQVKKHKKKELDLSDIQMEHIPEHLRKLIGYDGQNNKEDNIEAN
jgi:hypothetical protein